VAFGQVVEDPLVHAVVDPAGAVAIRIVGEATDGQYGNAGRRSIEDLTEVAAELVAAMAGRSRLDEAVREHRHDRNIEALEETRGGPGERSAGAVFGLPARVLDAHVAHVELAVDELTVDFPSELGVARNLDHVVFGLLAQLRDS